MRTILFTLSLLCLPVQAETFEAWVASYSLTGDNAATTADPDGDGIPNLMEYALDGLNPIVTTSQGHASMPRLCYIRRTGAAIGAWEFASFTKPPTDGTGGVWHVAMRFVARPGISGVRFVPQVSSNLHHWNGGRCASYLELLPGNVVQATALTKGNRHRYMFMRLKVRTDSSVTETLSGIPISGAGAYALVTQTASSQLRSVGTPTSVDTTNQDLFIRRETAASRVSDFVWNFQPAANNIAVADVERISSDLTKLAPVVGNPYLWQWMGNGSVTITLRTPSSTYQQTVTAATSAGGTVDVVTGGVAGSLRVHLEQQMDTRLATAAAPLTSLPIYSVQDHASGTYVRNTACWGATIDLTPCSPWNSGGGSHQAGTLITPRHVLFAAHYQPGVGSTIRFIKSDNTVVTRTLTNMLSLTQSASYYPDFTVGKLDSDVPAGIAFCRVLPDAWAAKLPTLGYGAPIVSVGLDQEEKLLTRETMVITGSPYNLVQMRQPANSTRAQWFENVIGGDSGNPGCLVINDKLVLLTVWTTGGGGAGTSVVSFKTQLNAALTTLGGGYTLTDVDLSGFTSF